MVKFVPAVARVFCLALLGPFLTMFAQNKGDLCNTGQQVVLWNGSASSKRTIKYGVRQGSILGPLLYILLTRDLPKKMTTNIDSAAQATASCYADDSTGVTYAKTWSSRETAMDEIARNLAEYSATNGLYLNAR